MFPDSGIAKNFSCGKAKRRFIVKFGIAPYFVELLNSQLKDLEHFASLFDESFNCVAKKIKKNGSVYSVLGFQQRPCSYKVISSEFHGKSSANDICSHFEQCLGPLEKEKLFQVSSDGPNVNLLFSKSLQKSVRMKNLTN